MTNVNLSDAFMLNDYIEGLNRNKQPQSKPLKIPQEALDLDSLNAQSNADNIAKYGENYVIAIIQKIGQQEAKPKELTDQEKMLDMVKKGHSTNYILSKFQ